MTSRERDPLTSRLTPSLSHYCTNRWYFSDALLFCGAASYQVFTGGSIHVWCLAYHTDELNTEMWNTKKTPSKLHKATNLWLALVGGVIRKVAPASISGQRIWTHQTIGVTLNRCVLLIWENQHVPSSTRERIWMHQQVLVLLLRYFAGVTLVSLWCYFCAQLSGAVWLACVGAWCSGAEEVTKSHAGALLFIALLACSLHVSTAACTLLDCTLACTGFP